MFLHRDDASKQDAENTNITELIIAKHRNGPVGTIKLVWIPEFTLFKSIAKKDKT
jgi:replicative DNA helicase